METYVTDLIGPLDPDPESQSILSSEGGEKTHEELGVKFSGSNRKVLFFLSKLMGLDTEPDSEKTPESGSGSNKFNKFGCTALQFLA
jgi:hypothetical protein